MSSGATTCAFGLLHQYWCQSAFPLLCGTMPWRQMCRFKGSRIQGSLDSSNVQNILGPITLHLRMLVAPRTIPTSSCWGCLHGYFTSSHYDKKIIGSVAFSLEQPNKGFFIAAAKWLPSRSCIFIRPRPEGRVLSLNLLQRRRAQAPFSSQLPPWSFFFSCSWKESRIVL